MTTRPPRTVASRRGLAVTAGILVAVTAASFAVWIVPQGSDGPSLAVSDHRAHLDGIRNIHATIMADMDEGYEGLLAGEVGAAEYGEMAEASSEQVRQLIIDTIAADPPDEWLESYGAYAEALRQYNTYIRETAFVASAIDDAGHLAADAVREAAESAASYEPAVGDMMQRSEAARPG